MKEKEAKRARMDHEKTRICVLDASNYVGFWILKGLLSRGYEVHAAIQKHGDQSQTEIEKKIREMEKMEERLVVFCVDVLDYHSILVALKGCSALFCCLDSSDGYDDKIVDLEVRGAINIVEACAQTESIEKIVFTSCLTAAIWRENICAEKDVDERSWSDREFCRKLKLWYALAKTLSEQAAWALAMDRMVNMVSINAGLVLGPGVTQQNSRSTMSYLQEVIDLLYSIHQQYDSIFLLPTYCRDLWYALAKTLSEQAAWALAMDRMVNMVSINAGLVLGPGVTQQNSRSTMSYLQGAAQMYENGVLAFVDVNFLVNAHIRAFEDRSTCGRYFCFNQIVNTEEEAIKLAQSLSPLISLPARYECQGSEVFAERLRTKKLNKLVEGTAC
ncbi:tetraketide alpha-pyrone reductase 1 [Quercus suber]|uniref:Tetraketide alpha-pyrone reductase 1 n=1 Tax=Quercus suber TaxID=58331 RepID=A0AAW0LUJ0_QUESU